MGFFSGASKRESEAIIARHKADEKREREAKERRKKEREKYGRRGRGILCGWASDDE